MLRPPRRRCGGLRQARFKWIVSRPFLTSRPVAEAVVTQLRRKTRQVLVFATRRCRARSPACRCKGHPDLKPDLIVISGRGSLDRHQAVTHQSCHMCVLRTRGKPGTEKRTVKSILFTVHDQFEFFFFSHFTEFFDKTPPFFDKTRLHGRK